MTISVIAAMGKNRAIGINGDLPWQLQADLNRFQKLTIGHTVIMGRKTYESINRKFGGGLPDRTNIVISTTLDFDIKGCMVARSLDKAFELADICGNNSDEVFVIGGEQIYKLALPFADKAYLTWIAIDIDGDAFFPEINHGDWEVLKTDCYLANNDNPFSYTFFDLKRKEKKKVVDPRFAKGKEYGGVIEKIAAEWKCPFCPDNFKYHKEPILKKSKKWFLTKSSWPYENTQQHFLIIGYEHKERLSQMDENDWKEIELLAKWASSKFKLEGGALVLRFGDTDYTGATVCHLHFHLIMPQKSKTVNFPIG